MSGLISKWGEIVVKSVAAELSPRLPRLHNNAFRKSNNTFGDVENMWLSVKNLRNAENNAAVSCSALKSVCRRSGTPLKKTHEHNKNHMRSVVFETFQNPRLMDSWLIVYRYVLVMMEMSGTGQTIISLLY
jgi:hypothetical protein